jgi:hypothetical protein
VPSPSEPQNIHVFSEKNISRWSRRCFSSFVSRKESEFKCNKKKIDILLNNKETCCKAYSKRTCTFDTGVKK